MLPPGTTVSTATCVIPWRHRLIARYYRAPEHPGRLRMIGWLKALLGVRVVRVEVVRGVVMDLDENDYVQREILFHGGYELATLACYDALLRDARGAVDFGAHMGLFTLRAARALAPRNGRVFAIEPTPAHSVALLHNAALSGLRNISLCTAACSDAPALLRMIAPHKENTGGSRLANDGTDDLRAIPLHVPVRPAGELVSIIPPACLDLVKIDVEGHEFRILRSLFAATAIRPRNIIFEFNPRDFNYGDPATELEWLRSERYALCDVSGKPFVAGAQLPDANLWAHLMH
jgi:FkbM family methyltransferase